MNTSKDTKNIIIAAGLAAVAAVGLYLIFKKKGSEKGGSVPKVNALTEQQKVQIIAKIKSNLNESELNPNNIVEIIEAASKFAAADFISLTHKNRSARRAVKNDLAQYAKIMEDYLNEQEATSRAHQGDILNRLGIPQETWHQVLYADLSEGNEQIYQAMKSFSQSQLEGQNTKSVSVEEFKRVFKRHMELYHAQFDIVSELQSLVTNHDNIPIIIHQILSDKIFEEFGYEEEDLLPTAKQVHKLPGQAQSFEDLSQAIQGATKI